MNLCLNHAAGAGDECAIDELRRRGKAGRDRQQTTIGERATRVVKLRDANDLLTVLERHLVAVEASKGEIATRAGAVVKIVAEAKAILKSELLEKENAELRKLLTEKYPELRKQLRSVP